MLSELIGNTPLEKIGKIISNANVFCKMESLNPGGSIKDRLGLALLQDAEKKGIIDKETVIIEPTSGNTGIALAMLCAERNYALKIVMPENMSAERIKLIKAYGADLVLTQAEKGMGGAIEKAIDLSEKYPNSYIPFQFKNFANPMMHYLTTGPEIWESANGNINILVCGVGTGGTITGCARFLKENNPNIKIVAVEPFESAVLSGEPKGVHKIQGIGAGFIPDILDLAIIDEIVKVRSEDAIRMAKQLMKVEGISCGISSGANVYAASIIAEQQLNKGSNIVTFVCDNAERYMSTDLFK